MRTKTTWVEAPPSGIPVRWAPGQSGNESGVSPKQSSYKQVRQAICQLPPEAKAAAQAEFDAELYKPGRGTEAFGLLWAAAKDREPWAVMDVCKRLAPQVQNLKLEVQQNGTTGFDIRKFTPEQLQQFIELAELAQPTRIEGGTVQEIVS